MVNKLKKVSLGDVCLGIEKKNLINGKALSNQLKNNWSGFVMDGNNDNIKIYNTASNIVEAF